MNSLKNCGQRCSHRPSDLKCTRSGVSRQSGRTAYHSMCATTASCVVKSEDLSKTTAVLLSNALTCLRKRKLSMTEHLDSHVLHLDILRQCPLACVCLYCLHSSVVDVSAWCELWRHSCIIHHIPSRMCMVPVCQG